MASSGRSARLHLPVSAAVRTRDREGGCAGTGAGRARGGWQVDETYVKVRGRVVLPVPSGRQAGQHDRFYHLADAEHDRGETFSWQGLLRGLKDWERPEVINTDKAPTYAAALAELKAEGKCPKDTQHRQVTISEQHRPGEADHGKLKQLIRPVRGFKSMKTAYATIKGFEVMRALSARVQAAIFNLTRDILGEARLVERAFGLGPSALTEAVQLVGERPRPREPRGKTSRRASRATAGSLQQSPAGSHRSLMSRLYARCRSSKSSPSAPPGKKRPRPRPSITRSRSRSLTAGGWRGTPMSTW